MQTSDENIDISEVSNPPTYDQIKHLRPTSPSNLPKKYTREIEGRVFVNRSVNLEKTEYIGYVGYIMNYTLAVYKKAYEELAYKLVVEKLIQKGYPSKIQSLKYDPSFPIRGLILDTKQGNLLKIDHFGYILKCVHGKKRLSKVRKFYPDKIVHPEDIGKRYFYIDTLFGLPEACLYSDLVDLLEREKTLFQDELEQGSESSVISFRSLFEDVRTSMHTSHIDESLKKAVMGDLQKYVEKDEKLSLLLHRLRVSGKKLFLMTNSEYYYTKDIMEYLLNGVRDDYKSWVDYFDIVITNASKPKYFESGTTLREIDIETGNMKFTRIESFEKGKIYTGGNLKLFKKFTNTNGSEILYVGDNIMSDVLYSKTSRCLWRTCLVVRELKDENEVWKNNKKSYYKLTNIEYLRAKSFQGLNSSSTDNTVDSLQFKKEIKEATEEFDSKFNKYFGSTFRSGNQETYFSNQVQRYSDLYCSDYTNLLNYPFNYYFSALPKTFPHESTEFNR